MILASAVDTIQGFAYVLFLVYLLCIFAYILTSWIPLPYNVWLNRVQRFLYDVVDPYLRLFRRFLETRWSDDTLTLAPEKTFDDPKQYLWLRSAYYRLTTAAGDDELRGVLVGGIRGDRREGLSSEYAQFDQAIEVGTSFRLRTNRSGHRVVPPRLGAGTLLGVAL